MVTYLPAFRRSLLALPFGGALVTAGQAQSPASRAALVIGNGAYRNVAALTNPVRDARLAADAFARLGCRTELLLDGSQAAMRDALRWLAGAATGADAAIFYYAGHAVEAAGRNLLLPVSVTARGGLAGLEREAITFDEVTSLLQGRAQTTLVFLDSCRDNPFRATLSAIAAAGRTSARTTPGTVEASRSVGGGLAGVSSGSGMLIAFATAPGQVALDGQGSNSPFTEALVRHIEAPGIEVRQMLGRVRQTVREATAGQQIPWDNSSLEGSFYFRPPTADPAFRRTIEAAAARSIALPPDLRTHSFRAAAGRLGRFVGSWGGDGRWGGVGRQIVLVVLSVDLKARTADVIHGWGPGTAQAANLEAKAGWARRFAILNEERIEFSTREGWRYAFAFVSDDELLGTGTSPQGRDIRIRSRRIE